MNRKTIATCLLLSSCFALWADVRVNVRLGAGHPIRRPGRTVVVRPVRPGVVVRPAPAFAAPMVFARTVVTLPTRDRLTFEDSETIHRKEGWVDSTLHVDRRGDRLVLGVAGRAEIDFVEIHFRNGPVQVVDCQDQVLGDGAYSLLNFADGRHVDNVRIIARARSPQARLTVYLAC